MNTIFQPNTIEEVSLQKTPIFQAPIEHPAQVNIGKKVRFKRKKGFVGTKYSETHYIQHLQRDFTGAICYRVKTDESDFGRVMKLDEAVFVT